MSNKALTIPTIFSAVDKMTPKVKAMGAGLDGFTAKLEQASAASNRLFSRLTPSLSDASKQFLSIASTAAVATGAIATARYSMNAIMEYETAIQSLQAVTGVSNSAMEGFKMEIASLGAESKKSSIDIAKSFETIGSMMSQYLEDPKALRQIAAAGITLSKAARMELEPSLQSLTSVMNQFQLKAGDAADVVNRLTAGEIVGSIRTSEATNYLQEFGAVAKTMNVNVSESVALIEALGIQMDKTKIGVGARNILTAISAAGGLDRKARQDLQAAGVDMSYLMDNTKTLSQRLHELSKIANDPVKMISVFGKENVTAASVIFQQLGKYDAYIDRIYKTNEAQKQATINSDTFAQAIDRLKNRWVNMLTSSTDVSGGLTRLKNIVNYVTENLDTLVNVGLNILKFMAAWKVLNVAMNAVITISNIRLGIQNALRLQSTALIEGNVIATKASIITEKAMAAAIALSTGNLTAFNAALAMSPLGWAVIAVGALAAGYYLLNKRQEELQREYQAQLNLRVDEAVRSQTSEVEKLSEAWQKAGYSIRTATIESLRFKMYESRQAVEKATSEKEAAKKALMSQIESNTWNPFFNIESARSEYDTKNQALTEARARSSTTTNALVGALNSGILNASEANKIMNGGQVKTESPYAGITQTPVQRPGKERVITRQEQVLRDQVNEILKQSITVIVKNESNAPAEVQMNKTQGKSVMPNMTTTLVSAK